jgi:hypothetical protein
VNRRHAALMRFAMSAIVALAAAQATDVDAQVRRGRALEPGPPPWAPTAIGIRAGYDQTARGEIFGGGLRVPILRNGLFEFAPSADIIFMNGPNEYMYSLDVAYVPGGVGGGLVIQGGVGWRDSTIGGGVGETYFGYNFGIGGKTNLGPVQLEAMIRWAFLNGTTYDPNVVTLGGNYVLFQTQRPGR